MYVVIDAERCVEILPSAGWVRVIDRGAPLIDPERHTLPGRGLDLAALVRRLVTS